MAMFNYTKGEMQYGLGLLNIIRKGSKLGLDFPALIEIQTINRCNSSCPMCPYSKTIAEQPFQKMDDETFNKLLAQLVQEPSFQILVLSFQNESLVDKSLEEKAKRFKEILPGKQLQIVTNGSLLDKDRAALIYKYFDLVHISVNAHSKKTYDAAMKGLPWETTIRNIEHVAANKEWREKTILRFIKQKENIMEAKEFKKYWNKKGFRVFGFDINSRLSSVANYDVFKVADSVSKKIEKQILKILSGMLAETCPIPFVSFYIRANGDVVLCFNDYTEDHIFGNINKQSIREIFNSSVYTKIRQDAKDGKLDQNGICSTCDLYKDAIWLTV